MQKKRKKNLAKCAKKYQNSEKQKLHSNSAEKYQSMSPVEKQKLFSNYAIKSIKLWILRRAIPPQCEAEV